jgi:lipopolysaccharide biosynthesis regulator YciM
MFRFTIRELVLLTLVVAMGVGWWISHYRLATVNRELLASLKSVESAMESHGFQMLLNPRTGKASWSFGDIDVDDP